MIGAGRVGGAGLCDLRPSAFISLYNQATVKPTSIQVDILKGNCQGWIYWDGSNLEKGTRFWVGQDRKTLQV